MAKQGKCDECQRIFVWPWDTPIGNTRCPIHKSHLKRTTKLAKFPRFNVTNSDVEIVHQRRRKATPEELSHINPKVGPGTD